MKKILILMAVFIAITNPVWAGHGRNHDSQAWEEGREVRMKERMDRLAKDLELTADQKVKFDKILKEHGDQFKELAEKTQEKKKELKDEMDKDMQKLLTKEQKEKYESWKEKRKAITRKNNKKK